MNVFAKPAAMALWVTALVAGCGGTTDDNRYQGPPWPVSCTSDTDCALGKSCVGSFGICVKKMPVDSIVTFTTVPAATSGNPSDQFNEVPVSAPGKLDVTMAPAIAVDGLLVRADQNGSVPAGRVTATAEGRIPGIPIRHEAEAIQGETGTVWHMNVLPDVSYAMTYLADDDSEPAHYWTLDAGMSGPVDVAVPAATSYFRLSGIVRISDGDTKSPVAGASVSTTVDSRPASSDTTDVNGLFHVALPPTGSSVSIHVKPGDDGPAFPERTLKWDGIDALRNSLPLNDFLVIEADPVPEMLTITLQVLGIRDAVSRLPMTSALVFIDGQAGGGTWSTSGTVDDNSVSTAAVPAGTYSLLIVPPSGSVSSVPRAAMYSVGTRFLDLSATQARIFAIEIPQRPKITGRLVYAGSNEPIEGARIRIASTIPVITQGKSAVKRDIVHETMSNAAGDFGMYLDPGTYAVKIDPPAGSGLAPASWPAVTFAGTENIQISLEDGFSISGHLVDSNGNPVGGALVSFLFPSTTEFIKTWPFVDCSFALDMRTAAQSVTDRNGRYEAVIPRPGFDPAAIGAAFSQWP